MVRGLCVFQGPAISVLYQVPLGIFTDWDFLISSQDKEEASWWLQENDGRQQVTSFSAQCHNHEEKLGELTVLLQKLQARVDQIDDGREGLSLQVKDVVGQHLQEMNAAGLLSTKVRPRSSWQKMWPLASCCANCPSPQITFCKCIKCNKQQPHLHFN